MLQDLDPALVQWGVIGMVALAVGGVAYVFASPFLSGERRASKRMQTVANRKEARRQDAKARETANRRKVVQDSLKDLEEKQRKKHNKPNLKQLIAQAGLSMSLQTFFLLSAILGIGVGGTLFVLTGKPMLSAGAAFAAALGFPRWVLNFMRNRRLKKFLEEFPNAIDVIVRGVKSGLPLNDTVRMIATESAEPVRSEFREVVESQAVGLPVSEGLERMYQRIPLPEVNFLAIVIHIQSQAGGNLAEALNNLAKVLRDRKRLKSKIVSMSQEAKASAAIIASLPFAVMILVYITTPAYIALLWEREVGHMMLIGSAVWMLIGVLVMKKMINFDF